MPPRITLLTLAVLVSLNSVATAADPPAGTKQTRPNIVWIIVDDMSANFSCYGESLIQTPHVDRLAREGTRFSRAFVTAPVCSACRSALITGMYQTTIGAQHHRSGRGKEKIQLPDGIVPIPALFQQAGYFTCIGDGLQAAEGSTRPKRIRLGKTDYNFEWDSKIYDSADWSDRRPGQPFFMQVQLLGGKLRGESLESARKLAAQARTEFGESTSADKVSLPPYYPSDPVLREDWAAYLDAVRMTDRHVGKVIERLQHEEILDQTLIIFMTDHGISHARGKQFLYDEGTHVPLVVRGPGISRGVVRTDLIQQIDLAALSLAAAGIDIPATMEGKDLFAANYRPREAVFAARDRCDETVERIRSVRTDRWLYIRNGFPARPHLQPNAYKDNKAIVKQLRLLHDKGALNELQETLLFSPTRPAEELYEWTTDRFQIRNVANNGPVLTEMRKRLDDWISSTGDQGQQPESAAMYDSDMAVYLERENLIVERNIAQMKQWAKEGK